MRPGVRLHRKQNATSGFLRSTRKNENRGAKQGGGRSSKKTKQQWWSWNPKDVYQQDDDAIEDSYWEYRMYQEGCDQIYQDYLALKFGYYDPKKDWDEDDCHSEWSGGDYHHHLCTYPHYCSGIMHECW